MKMAVGLLVAATMSLSTGMALGADQLHFFYIEKVGTAPWFIDEVAGAQAEAARLAVKFSNQDVKADANLAITAVETAIGAGASAIVVVVPDQEIGPAVLKMAKDAHIPVIAVDDSIKNAAGVAAPFVGFSAVEVGKQVGDSLADFHTSLGWGAKLGPGTRLISAEIQGVSVCMDRTNGAIEVLKARLGLTDSQILHVAIDPGTQDVALANIAQAITAQPGVKRWLISSCGDEGVLGGVRALEQAGYATQDIIGVGINGQLVCEEFKKASPTGFLATVAFESKLHGQTAIKELYINIVDGAAIPARATIAGKLITRDDNASYCKG